MNAKYHRLRRNRQKCVPKRLFMLNKSRAMQRWLLQNPWIRPMSVFNYAAIQIQKIIRGLLVRLKGDRSLKAVCAKVTTKSSKQLDRYLIYLDSFKNSGKREPRWLASGYSTWCAVRIQSWVRMLNPRRMFLCCKQLVCQVATIVIQTAWHNFRFRRVRSYHPRKMTDFLAAQMIQLQWRAYCNRRIYHYFRDLVVVKLRGLPADLLRSIIPNESVLLDRAAGVHVRFRLGGSVFPPRVYFKIFTHRGVCDVNSFAPRDYKTEEKWPPGKANSRHSTSETTGSIKNRTQLKVGQRYFNTVVSTTSDMKDWYKRDERNNWRSLSWKIVETVSNPPWFVEGIFNNHLRPFHFNPLRRRKDIEKHRRNRKRDWMRKVYTLVADAAQPKVQMDGMSTEPRNAKDTLYSNSFVEDVMEVIKRSAEAKAEPKSYESPKKKLTGLKESSQSEVTSSPRDQCPKISKSNDLIEWSMALDFDEYCKGWNTCGITLPSDAKHLGPI